MNDSVRKSVIWQSKIAMLSTAGINKINKDVINWISYFNQTKGNSFVYRADIFVDGDDIIYFLNLQDSFLNKFSNKIEAGIVTKDKQNGDQKLKKYIEAFVSSAKNGIDGRRTRFMKFEWYYSHKNEKIETHVNFYKAFIFPAFTETDTRIATFLSEVEKREQLIKMSKYERINTEGSKKVEKNSSLINELLNFELIRSQYAIICRKKSIPIGVISSEKDIVDKNNKLLCPHCGISFDQEIIRRDYILTDLGKKMITSSHWMTILLTDILIKNGIPKQSIIWNLMEASEEADCAVQFKDKVWIFELKDRNFESGDAHALIYRAIKFKAKRIIIFTTGKVTRNAINVFDEIYNERSFSSEIKFSYPIFIEGIEEAEPIIKTLIKNETLFSLREKVLMISRSASTDFSLIFSKFFGDIFIEHKGKFSSDRVDSYFWM